VRSRPGRGRVFHGPSWRTDSGAWEHGSASLERPGFHKCACLTQSQLVRPERAGRPVSADAQRSSLGLPANPFGMDAFTLACNPSSDLVVCTVSSSTMISTGSAETEH